MDIKIMELAVRAASSNPGAREVAGDELVRLVQEGGSYAADAADTLCDVEKPRIFHFFAIRVSDDQDASDLTEKLLEKLRKAFQERRLRLEHGARSFYEYVYTTARRDYQHYVDKRSRLLVVEPEIFDMTDRWSEQPSVEELARSQEMYRWLRQATTDIPDDLNLLMLAYAQDLPRDQLIKVSGISKLRFDKRLSEAKNKVIDRFVCLFIARTRGVDIAGAETCPGLINQLNTRVRPAWEPSHPFTTPVYKMVKRHINACETCGDDYQDKKRRGMRREFLVLPFVAMPDRLRDRAPTVGLTSATPVAPSWPRAMGAKRVRSLAAVAACAVAVVGVLFAADHPDDPTNPESLDRGAPHSTTTTTTSSPPSSTSTTAGPQTIPTSEPPTSAAESSAAPPTTPSTASTEPPTPAPTTQVVPAPLPPLQISLATSAAACSPADSCNPVPSCDTCSTDYVGDCTQGVALNFNTIIAVNRGPTELTFRWRINGTPLSTESVSFPDTGHQQTSVGQVTVLYASSGPWTAQLEVLTPQASLSNMPQATITCT